MKENKITSNRKLAIVIGGLFIIATLMGVLTAGMVGPLFGGEDYLKEISYIEGRVLIASIMNFIMAASVVAISVVIYPILKQVNELMAISYLASRIFEGIVLASAGLIWVVLVQLGQEFAEAAMPAHSHFQSLGNVLVSLSTNGFTLGASIVFGFTAIILNDTLYRYKLVPDFIAIWGFVGGLLIMILGVMKVLDIDISSIEIAFTAPIALNEMVLAVWLIVKGFKTESLK